MTEQDLIDLGFNKVEVLNEDSQNGYDYFYYVLNIFDNLSLISSENDRVKEKNDWTVTNLDWPNHFLLQSKLQVQDFLHAVGYSYS